MRSALLQTITVLLGSALLVIIGCTLPLEAKVTFTGSVYSTPIGNGLNGITISADLDHDGRPDLITVEPGSGHVSILYGVGSGKFGTPQSVFVGSDPVDVQVGDFNGDGYLDLVVANRGSANVSSTISVLTGQAGRTFIQSTITIASFPAALAVGDFNGDGHLDFAVAIDTGSSTSIQIYNGNGNGTFTQGTLIALTDTSPSGSYRLFAEDLNEDGKVDLINVGGQTTTILLASGNGAFYSAQLINPPVQGAVYKFVDVADLNGDAAPDLLLSDISHTNSGDVYAFDSYLNDGTGHFTFKQSVTPSSGASSGNGAILADINYDGIPDFVYIDDPSFTSASLGYALGNGDGTFQTTALAGPVTSGTFPTLKAHDLNNDGLMDLIATGPQELEVELNSSARPDCSSPNSQKLAVHVCSPVSGTTVSSPFTVRAAANSPTDVLRIEAWLDGKKVGQQLSNQLRLTLNPSAGTHTLTIIPVDIFGSYIKHKLTITVQ